MREIRWWVAALILWFVALFAGARLYEPMISTLACAVAGAVAIATVTVPGFRSAGTRIALGVPLVLFVLLKAALDYPIFGEAFSSTFLELGVIGASMFLAMPVADRLGEFERSAGHALVAHLNDPSVGFDAGKSAMYREVRRARSTDRPLTMVALSVARVQHRTSIDRLVERIWNEGIQNYIQARLVHLLADETREADVVTHKGDCVYALLTETDVARAHEVTARLNETMTKDLGLEVRIGLSSFPNESVTMDGLLEEAESSMREDPQTEITPRRPRREITVLPTLDAKRRASSPESA